jgi:serine/threonine-protein kinase HipA
MRRALILFQGASAGILEEHSKAKNYIFRYNDDYSGEPVSLTLPINTKEFTFNMFPPFLDGLLPEGEMLEALLRQKKIDRDDYLSQLLVVGSDLVGAITVQEIE